MLIAGAAALLVAIIAGTSARRSMATEEEGLDPNVNLAADALPESKASRTIPDAESPRPKRPESPAHAAETDGALDDEDEDAAARRGRKRRRGRRHRLKQNPYE